MQSLGVREQTAASFDHDLVAAGFATERALGCQDCLLDDGAEFFLQFGDDVVDFMPLQGDLAAILGAAAGGGGFFGGFHPAA